MTGPILVLIVVWALCIIAWITVGRDGWGGE